MKRAAALLIAVCWLASPLSGSEENDFVYAQLKFDGDWDPYPNVWPDIAAFLSSLTSVRPVQERRVVDLDDGRLFESPFVALTGRGRVRFSQAQRERLKNYLSRGGFLFVDSTEAARNSPFIKDVEAMLVEMFPEEPLQFLPQQNAVSKTFFLIRAVSGRRIAEPQWRGLKLQGRLAVLISANDLHGVWAKDLMGRYVNACEPAGENQRLTAQKWMVNVIVFSLTGTYKEDAIHQPFIEQKWTAH